MGDWRCSYGPFNLGTWGRWIGLKFRPLYHRYLLNRRLERRIISWFFQDMNRDFTVVQTRSLVTTPTELSRYALPYLNCIAHWNSVDVLQAHADSQGWECVLLNKWKRGLLFCIFVFHGVMNNRLLNKPGALRPWWLFVISCHWCGIRKREKLFA